MAEQRTIAPHILVVTGFSDIAEAHLFIGLAKAGCKITLISEPEARFNPAFRETAGIKLIEMRIKGRFDRAARQRIRQICIEEQIQLVHAMNNRAVANALAASKGLPVKFIAYRGIAGNDSYYDPASWQTYLNPRVDRVICVAEAIKRYFLKISFLGLRQKPSKFTTVYKGHDLQWYRQPYNSLDEMGIPENSFIISSVANDRPRKGIALLIEAFTRIAQELPDARLLLVGQMDQDKLLQTVQSSQVRQRIHFTGSRTDAPSLVSASDIYVLPAIKREGLPKTVIEAMAYGIPPIVTDSGGSPELIENGVSGLIVPSGDIAALMCAIKNLYHTGAENRQEMGQAAQTRIREKFSVNATVQRTLEIYQELLANELQEAKTK